ncbi:hypothetical protein MSAN_00632900 [Mycena sanguinolenta]|uniref:Uncharacterized protein n=1 Tax=Mycena sanguinolenta TaxID=230812 RepID=A0A8H7DC44_9AGAR|nr:hypothetical protein MSAN_00632900 [Mycena sanguinolenta]
MNRSSWAKHLATPTHSLSLQQLTEAEEMQNNTRRQYDELYATPAVPLRIPNQPLEFNLRQAHFRPILLDEDMNGVSNADFEDLMMQELDSLKAGSEDDFMARNAEALRREIEILELQHLEAEFEGADDETIPCMKLIRVLSDLLHANGEDEDIINQHFTGVPVTHDYAPYGNKTMCYLDILDNLPRLRLSSSQLKMILWIMEACGAKDVPSFNAFRAMQKHIRKMTGVRSEPHKSDLGNLFYVNDIRDLIAKDFANPEVAPHIQKYPEDVAGGPISEFWQVKDGKWHNIPLDELTPSIVVGHTRFYVHEVAELGKTYADCQLIVRDPVNSFQIRAVSPAITRIPLEDLCFNHEALERRIGTKIIFHENCREYSVQIPNKFRQVDNGEDLFTVWVPVWADDVSGARSKQYQKHLNVYTANANLPGQLLQQEYFVRFVSTSPHAGALEQLKVVVNHVKSTHREPVRTYNADTQRPCAFRLNVPDGPADNPQQAEESSHIGHHGNYFCRRCHVGGTSEEKECPDGYHSFYTPGRPRNVEEIRSCVLAQIRLSTYGIASRVEALQTSTGIKDKIAQHWIDILIQKAREAQAASPSRDVDEISTELLIWLREQTNEPYNPLLDLPFFDPSQDTLVEILHTILLGDAKYTWYELHHKWTAMQQDIFTIRLQGTNLDGLRVPPIRAAYMMQYRNGLIGKHFKTLMQTMIFHIHDIVTPDQFVLVRALGELGPILWLPVIDNMEEYLADLQIFIDNLLDAFASIDPTKILIKLKLHVLQHIIQDIRRRGPAAPSRDIAAKFADLDRVKHILSGGYWFDESQSAWAMLIGAANPASIPLDSATSWVDGVNVATTSGDRCILPVVGRVLKILLPKGSKSAQGILVVTKYDVGEALHPHYHMPILLPNAVSTRVVVPSNSIQFSFNVQHDCRACGCDASGVTRQMQERQESDTTIHSIVHKDDTRFIINTHGFHNAGLLRKYLPVALTKPRPLFPDRRKRHDELSAVLAVTQKAKRAAIQEKAAATREKTKAARAGVAAGEAQPTGAANGEHGGGPQKRTRHEIEA